ncbi:hypothetical protein H7J71_18025, partial [Mycolicibacterium peregrinum]|nr:hypothetical protein [Mycolicibacterium peregrinum]
AYWSEPEPRWPKSPPQPHRASGPERSAYPLPQRRAEPDEKSDRPGPERSAYPLPQRRAEPDEKSDRPGQAAGAEDMSPDPVDAYADMPVDVMDSEVRDADLTAEDSAYVRSYLQGLDSTLANGHDLDGGGADWGIAAPSAKPRLADDQGGDAAEGRPAPGRFEALWRAGLVVFQSMLAVAFGAGLFVAFDQLWRWNSIVALVLSVLVILGLVVGVRVVRKTEDITSTLIAVAVGALITL